MTDIVVLTIETGRPKLYLVEQAYGVCGIRRDSLGTDMLVEGLADLNMMMMEEPWSGLGFTLPAYGDGDLAEACGVLDKYVPAIIYELAMRRAAALGKELSTAAAARVRMTRRSLDAILCSPPELKMRGGVYLGRGRQRFRIYPLYSTDTAIEEETVSDDDPGVLSG